MPEIGEVLEIGKGRILREGSKVAILSYGGRMVEVLKAADNLEAKGLSTTVADARFAKPLDTALIETLAKENEVLITIEEGSIGGFASRVLDYLIRNDLTRPNLKIRPMTLLDSFQDQASPYDMYEEAQLNANHIEATALAALGEEVLSEESKTA